MSWIRLQFTKTGPARYLSHLDLTRTIERAARRAGLPLALSQGFHPMPRLVFASALALGTSSEAEYLDLELREELPPEEVTARLNAVLPEGIWIVAAKALAKKSSLPNEVNRAVYRVVLFLPRSISSQEIDKRIREVLASPELLVVREGKQGKKTVDLRPYLEELKLVEVEGEKVILRVILRVTPQGSARPEEVLEFLKLNPKRLYIHREGLYWVDGVTQRTPLEVL